MEKRVKLKKVENLRSYDQEVFKMIGEGYTLKSIQKTFCDRYRLIPSSIVEYHIKKIYESLKGGQEIEKQ